MIISNILLWSREQEFLNSSLYNNNNNINNNNNNNNIIRGIIYTKIFMNTS